MTRQASAAPFHDWNERVTAECYRPNAAARVVDDRGFVVDIVNNYEHLSFDAGPTLLAWLEHNDAETYRRIVEADRRTRGAIAQAHGHLILPLATERDVRTQVRWGLADFEHRFGRPSTGLWLPEAAVDDTVLSVLVDEGVRHTVVAPWQVARLRRLGSDEPWTEASPEMVSSQVLRWQHPAGDGRGIDIVVYDGPLSHAVAFEIRSISSQLLIDKAQDAPGDAVVVASDGETFGHHHTFADRMIAYAVATEAPRRGVRFLTIDDLVAAHPPTLECEVRTSAWSCAHGVERWRSDCGCATGGEVGWRQEWRAPLRAALDLLRQHLDEVFERRGKEVMHDPWRARDDYVHVLIGARSAEEFLAEWAIGDHVEVLTLLEAQRHAMSMYTSCGWFFNDLAGIETVQILRYACRVIDLLQEVGERPPVGEFLDVLSQARSNDPRQGNGRDIWEAQVLPSRVRPDRVVAHVALRELLEDVPPDAPVACHDVAVLEHWRAERGPLVFAAGHVAVTHRRTWQRTTHVFAALHLGGLEVIGVTRPARPDDVRLVAHLQEMFVGGSTVTALVRTLGDLGGREFGLASALPGHADEILATTAAQLAERFASAYERLFADHRETLRALASSGYELPPVLRAPAELALARRLEAEIAAQRGATDPTAYAGALAIVAEAEAAGVRLDTPDARRAATHFLEEAVAHAVSDRGDSDDAAAVAVAIVDLARRLGVHPDVERAQEMVFGALGEHRSPALRRLGIRLGIAVDALGNLP